MRLSVSVLVGVLTGGEYNINKMCFYNRHSSSESDTAEKKKKKRGKERLDGSERQK